MHLEDMMKITYVTRLECVYDDNPAPDVALRGRYHALTGIVSNILLHVFGM